MSNHDQATEPCHRIIAMRIGMYVCMHVCIACTSQLQRGQHFSRSTGFEASLRAFPPVPRTPSGGPVAERTRKPGHQQVASPFEEGKGYYTEIRSFEFDGLLIDPAVYCL